MEFGAISVAGGSAMVQVFLRASDGAVRGFLYSFTAESDGWKIDGVQPLEGRSQSGTCRGCACNQGR